MHDGFSVQQHTDDPEEDFLVQRARECLLWHMSPSDWDALTMDEHQAFVKAWNQIQKEGGA